MQKRRVGVHEVLEKLFEAIGIKEEGNANAGTAIVAKFLGVGRTTAYKWSDPDQDGEISFARVRLLTEHFGVTAAAEDIARAAGGQFVPLVVSCVPGKSVCQKISEGMKASTEFHANALVASSDGHIDATEAKALLEDLDRSEESNRRLRSRFEEIVRMGDAGARPVRMVVGTAR